MHFRTLSPLLVSFLAALQIASCANDSNPTETPPTENPPAEIPQTEGWIMWTGLVIALLLGVAVCVAGVWIGKAILSSAGVDRAWAVATSASGILVAVGFVFSTVMSPLTAPLMTIIFSAAFASGGVAPDDQQGIGLVLVFSILITVASVVAYAVAGSLVWWWMAHALRRSA